MIEAVRSQTDKPICVDVNQGWTDKKMALDMAYWLKEHGVVFIEQPMSKTAFVDTAWLTQNSPLPIIADEAFQTITDIKKVQEAYSGINVKLMKCGGLRSAYVIIKMAKALGMKVMIGCMTETSCAVSAAAQLSPLVDSGNWENGENVLHVKAPDTEISKKHNITLTEFKKRIDDDRELMLKNRNKRIKPSKDDKILTSWNAIMLKGYIDAYMAFGDEKFLTAALKNADFLTNNAISTTNEITRNYKNGKSSVPGLLDDYSFTISAFIDLYQATFNEKWLCKAAELTNYTITHFFDPASGMFYYTPDNHSDLIARKMEISDNVIPSSNSEMAMDLFLLGNYFNNDSYIQKAKQMLINVQGNLKLNILSYSNWGLLGIHFIKPIYEVAIVGPDWENIKKNLESNYLPDAVFLGGKNEGTIDLLKNKLVSGQATIYVCENKTCRIPVTNVSDALKQLK